jgi:hypothetical protein
MNHKRVSVSALTCFAGAVLAQAAPPVAFCCKYIYTMYGNGLDPEAACGNGSVTVSCEWSSTEAAYGELFAKYKLRGFTRQAECKTWTLGTEGYFIRADCTEPPSPGAKFVGNFGGGVCCWAAGPHLPSVVTTPQNYHVSECLYGCGGGIH